MNYWLMKSEEADYSIDDLKKDKFIELENEITHQFKVLASFKYLEQIVMTINISEEIKNEIPE